MRVWEMGMLAEAYCRSGEIDAHRDVLAEARVSAAQYGEGLYVAELYRLQGELLLARSAADHTEAAACVQQALTVARCQQAKAWELHAAMSLVRLWRQQGKHTATPDLLALLYHWCIEGFDTTDWREAKALRETLA